jgi:hypothetical protein
MPTVGEKCSICQRLHIIKGMETLENLSPKEKTQTFKAEPDHRLFISGYVCSKIMDNQVFEFYEALTVWKLSLEREEEEKEEELCCRLCNKPISKEEYEQYQGYHRDCFYIEEIQDSDDM